MTYLQIIKKNSQFDWKDMRLYETYYLGYLKSILGYTYSTICFNVYLINRGFDWKPWQKLQFGQIFSFKLLITLENRNAYAYEYQNHQGLILRYKIFPFGAKRKGDYSVCICLYFRVTGRDGTAGREADRRGGGWDDEGGGPGRGRYDQLRRYVPQCWASATWPILTSLV